MLLQIEEGPVVRFRCHTGRAFSLMTLLAGVNESIDTGLWAALRAVEERVMLLRQMEQLARASQRVAEADRCKRQADETEQGLKPLRELVLDPKFFVTTSRIDQNYRPLCNNKFSPHMTSSRTYALSWAWSSVSA